LNQKTCDPFKDFLL